MKTIELSQGKVALVDDENFEELSRYTWYAIRNRHRFYAVRHGKGPHYKVLSMHRQIVVPSRGLECDHINQDGLDNRRANLRLCTDAQNSHNQRSRCGSSKFKGVTFRKDRKKWTAQITLNGKQRHLGYFLNEEDAARRYDKAACELFGDFARPNFQDVA